MEMKYIAKAFYYKNLCCLFLISSASIVSYTGCTKAFSEQSYSTASDPPITPEPPPEIPVNSLVIKDIPQKPCGSYIYPSSFCVYQLAESQLIKITVAPDNGVLRNFSVSAENPTTEWDLDSSQCHSELDSSCVISLKYNPKQPTPEDKQQNLNLIFKYTDNKGKAVEKSQPVSYAAKSILKSQSTLTDVSISDSTKVIKKIDKVNSNLFLLINNDFYYSKNNIMNHVSPEVLNYDVTQFNKNSFVILQMNSATNFKNYWKYTALSTIEPISGLTDMDQVVDLAVSENGIYACKSNKEIYKIGVGNLKIENSKYPYFSQCFIDSSNGAESLYVFAYKQDGISSYLVNYDTDGGELASRLTAVGNIDNNVLLTNKDKIFIIENQSIKAYVNQAKIIHEATGFNYRTNAFIVNRSVVYDEVKKTLYFLTSDNYLHAISAETGAEQWSVSIEGSLNSKPFLSKSGYILVLSSDTGILHAYSPSAPAPGENKEVVFDYPLPSLILASVASLEKGSYRIHVPAVTPVGSISIYSLNIDW